MAPSMPAPAHTAAHAQTAKFDTIELVQPSARQTMRMSSSSNASQKETSELKLIEVTEPAASTPEQQKEMQKQELSLRGGEMCPGRFCFIIPCPLPCNCCII